LGDAKENRRILPGLRFPGQAVRRTAVVCAWADAACCPEAALFAEKSNDVVDEGGSCARQGTVLKKSQKTMATDIAVDRIIVCACPQPSQDNTSTLEIKDRAADLYFLNEFAIRSGKRKHPQFGSHVEGA
jgi:hypothetical protein